MRTHVYTIEIEYGEDGHYVVSVPALPGCFTQGDTYEEAISRAEEAIECYLEMLLQLGEPIPEEHLTHEAKVRSVLRVNTPILA